jgi:hypothetical protein
MFVGQVPRTMTEQELVILFQVKKRKKEETVCSSGHFKSWENADWEPDNDTIKMFVGQVPRTMTKQELFILFQVKKKKKGRETSSIQCR